MKINKIHLLQSIRELGLYLIVFSILIYMFEVDSVDRVRLGILFIGAIALWLFGLFSQADSANKDGD